MRTLVSRSITGFLLLVAALLIIIFGSRASLLLVLILISSLALQEFYRALAPDKKYGSHVLIILFNVVVHFLAYKRYMDYYVISWLVLVLLLFSMYVLQSEWTLKDLMVTLLASVYIGLLSSVNLFYPDGKQIYLLIVLCSSWGTDTCAYLFGMLFGKHPLTSISPKKTVEGSIGGTLGAVALGCGLQPFFYSEIGLIEIAVVTMMGSIVAQIGDLFASRIKRRAGIKDYGSLLHAHGGVLDRFDSLLFAGPTIWILMKLLRNLAFYY